MDFKILYHLMFGVFSLKKGNMRKPNLKRILIVLFLFPVFTVLLVINKFFLYLDYLVVPFFLSQKIKNPVFIVAAPRSGTTFLYHSMANQNDHFTCFKLWEIVLAPSVIQKFIWVGFIRLDRFAGTPIKRFVLFLENIFIRKLKKVHPISINLPEEDEAVLLWDLSSIYLNFFYPDSHFFDNYLMFDKNLSEKRRMKIMRSYRNYVRRHNFVFNRNGAKLFLSKNPLMMCKLKSLKTVFPDARILMINRSPEVTLPSTVALNNMLYSLFTSVKSTPELDNRTIEFLIQWYKMAHNAFKHEFHGQHLEIDFQDLISRNDLLQRQIATFVGKPLGKFLIPNKTKSVNHKSKNKYEKLTQAKLEAVLVQIPFMKKYSK